MLRCCFDKRVWIGLGLVAVALLIADPRAGWVALPVLVSLACPLSMLVMLGGMRRGAAVPDVRGGGQAAAGATADRAAEIARLRAEIGLLRTRAGEAAPARGESPATARAGRGQAG